MAWQFKKSQKDPADVVADFEHQIMIAEQDVKDADANVTKLELEANESDATEMKAALDKAYGSAVDAKNRLAGKERALISAQKKLQVALQEKENAEIQENWKKTADLGRQILTRSKVFEELQAEATKEFTQILDLTRKAMALVPRTDGTRPFDSHLSDGALTNYFRLEVNRNDLRVFAPEYSGPKTQRQFVNNMAEGLGWLLKLSPPEVKNSGDWVKG